jgi:nicotinamidase-related amidase
MKKELEDLQTAGANIVRVDLAWSEIEWSKGKHETAPLEKLKTLTNEASSRGIRVIATIADTPPWASTSGKWNDAPSKPSYYGEFVSSSPKNTEPSWLRSRY